MWAWSLSVVCLVVRRYTRLTTNYYRMYRVVCIWVVMRTTTTHLRSEQLDSLLSVRDASDALGVTPWWTRRLIASGDLRAINVGGPDRSARWRVAPEDLAAFIKARENRARDLLR